MAVRTRLILTTLGAALLLAACGSGETNTAVAPETVAAATNQDSLASDASTEPKSLSEYLGGAGNALRGTGLGGGNTDEDSRLEEQRLVQQEIQICMRAQGFTYVPEEVGTGLRFAVAAERASIPPLDYAQTQGFGISTAFDALFEADIDQAAAVDPNDAHLATLSSGEVDAWQLALRGAAPERNDQGQLIDPETGQVLQGRNGATGGCAGQAQLQVRGDFSALGEIEDDLTDLADRIAADPRVTQISRAWTDCMADSGFDYQSEGEARSAIQSEVQPLLRSFFSGAATQGGRGNPLQALAGLTLTADQEAELDVLQDLERAVAVASLTCQGDSAVEVAEITASYEAEFVEANRALLESLGD